MSLTLQSALSKLWLFAFRYNFPAVLAGIILTLFFAGLSSTLKVNGQEKQNTGALQSESARLAAEKHKRWLSAVSKLSDRATMLSDPADRARLQAMAARLWWKEDRKLADQLFFAAYNTALSITPASRRDAAVPGADQKTGSAPSDAESVRLRRAKLTCSDVRLEILQKAIELSPSLALRLVKLTSATDGCDYSMLDRNTSENPLALLYAKMAEAQTESDPATAVELATQSLDRGITSTSAHVIKTLWKKDPELAGRLMDRAIDRITTRQVVGLEIESISAVIFDAETSPAKEMREQAKTEEREERSELKRQFAVKFLIAALSAGERFAAALETNAKNGNGNILREPELSAIWAREADVPEAASSYYEALTGLIYAFERYYPDGLPRANSLVNRISPWMTRVDQKHMYVLYDNGDTPDSLLVEAKTCEDSEQRLELYGLAVDLALMLNRYDRAREIAVQVDDTEKRSELVDLVNGHLLSKALDDGRISDAYRLASTLAATGRQVNAMIDIANAAQRWDPHGKVAYSYWEETESILMSMLTGTAQASVLIRISVARADTRRYSMFEVLEKVIESVNLAMLLPYDEKQRERLGLATNHVDALSLFGNDIQPLLREPAKTDSMRATRMAQMIGDPALRLAMEMCVKAQE
jgi:hypothetical protein